MTEQRITISVSNLLVVLLTGLLLVLFWQLRSLLLTVMISVVVAASIVPVVNWAEKYGFPRWIATILVYLSLIGGFVGVGLLIGPTIIDQIDRLIRQLPVYLEALRVIAEGLAMRLSDNSPDVVRQFFNPEALTSWVIRSSQQVLLRSYGITRGILGGFLTFILCLFISGYMVSDSRTLINSLIRLFPKPWDERLETQVGPVGERMGAYLRGRILVSGILGGLTAVGLSVLGLSDFALGLGAIAGVTNLIPFLGPVLGTVPALVVAISQGGWLFLWVLILFVIIQNLETYVLDPFLVGSSVGVHPLFQLLSVLGGVQVLGIIGALIVPPWFAGVSALIENLYLKPKLLAERRAAREAKDGKLRDVGVIN